MSDFKVYVNSGGDLIAAGYALRAPPSATCRALNDLHHFLGHQPAEQTTHSRAALCGSR